MTTKCLTERAKILFPNVYRNMRGVARTQGKFICYGIPEPKTREKEDDLKGGDLIGFHLVKITPDMVGKSMPIFCNIEIKGDGDRIKEGQVRYHNLILELGGISEIHTGDGRVIRWKTTKKEVNNGKQKTKG